MNPPQSARSNQSQGRPIGLLASWLEMAEDFKDASSHSSMRRPTLEQRQDARARLEAMEGGVDFALTYERPKRPDEDPEPPSMT